MDDHAGTAKILILDKIVDIDSNIVPDLQTSRAVLQVTGVVNDFALFPGKAVDMAGLRGRRPFSRRIPPDSLVTMSTDLVLDLHRGRRLDLLKRLSTLGTIMVSGN